MVERKRETNEQRTAVDVIDWCASIDASMMGNNDGGLKNLQEALGTRVGLTKLHVIMFSIY